MTDSFVGDRFCADFLPILNIQGRPMKKSTGLSYRDAGVDIDAGDALVDDIKKIVKSTRRPEVLAGVGGFGALVGLPKKYKRSEEHTSELQSLMRISYAVFCLKKKKI